MSLFALRNSNPETKKQRNLILLTGANALLLIVLMVVGAVTRLTESGLSITEWRLFSGILPPFNAAGWQEYFNLYQQSSEYQQVHAGKMDLQGFKRIFWWEYIHRLLARSFAITYLLPLIWLSWRRQLPSAKLPQLWLIALLGALQGVIGWWMVKSGLSDRVDVSPIRLTIHLALAWAIYSLLLWQAIPRVRPIPKLQRNFARVGLVLLIPLLIFGALTAGSNAGFSNNTWPRFPAGGWLPHGYALLQSLFDPGTIQANHRMLAYLVFIYVWFGAGFILYNSKHYPNLQDNFDRWWSRTLAGGAIFLVSLQLLIGVATLVTVVAFGFAISHQLGALLLWSLLLLTAGQSQLRADSASSPSK